MFCISVSVPSYANITYSSFRKIIRSVLEHILNFKTLLKYCLLPHVELQKIAKIILIQMLAQVTNIQSLITAT